MGDGRRGFNFSLKGYLVNGLNEIALLADGQELTRKAFPFYEGPEGDNPTRFGSDDKLKEFSQARWLRNEPAEALTWGRPMEGVSLWRIYQEERRFGATDKILEIGPGYGRLLQSLRKLKIPFGSYTGVELSPRRVAQLRLDFNERKIKFHVGDVDVWKADNPFDAILCSVTFDFLFPDCRKALGNLRGQLAPKGILFVDFIPTEKSQAHFEPGGSFVRAYPEAELLAIFEEAGYAVRKIVNCTLGQGAQGPVERRVVVATAGTAPTP